MKMLKQAFARAGKKLRTLFFYIPILGQMAKDVRDGDDTAFMYFGANIAMLWLAAGFMWGITGLLAGAYLLLPCYFMILLTMMRA